MVASPLVMAEKARARLKSVVSTFGSVAPDGEKAILPALVDIVITPCEVNQLHGTGTLLFRLFPDSREILSLRTSSFYGQPQTFGAQNYCFPPGQTSRQDIATWVQWWLNGAKVRRVIVFPYLPMDPLVAIVIKELFRVPLCTYIMDDKNVCAEGIPDALMDELLAKSDLRLVISPEMRDAYARKYGMPFWLMPPLVPEAILHSRPLPLDPAIPLDRGVLLGNIWGQRWLEMLRDTFRGTGFKVDWYCNQKTPAGLTFDPVEMEADGIRFMQPIPEAELPATLAKYPYAVVPSDTFDGQSPPAVRAIAELSLLSRIPTIMTTSHLPILVLGHPGTCAARFVTRFGIGEVTPYESGAVRAALQRLSAPETQTRIRARAARLSPSFSSQDSADWIWRSLAAGAPCDQRYESLMPANA
jgi:hypothetical protein